MKRVSLYPYCCLSRGKNCRNATSPISSQSKINLKAVWWKYIFSEAIIHLQLLGRGGCKISIRHNKWSENSIQCFKKNSQEDKVLVNSIFFSKFFMIIISSSKPFFTLIGMLSSWVFPHTSGVCCFIWEKWDFCIGMKSDLQFSQSHVGQYIPTGKQFDQYFGQQT